MFAVGTIWILTHGQMKGSLRVNSSAFGGLKRCEGTLCPTLEGTPVPCRMDGFTGKITFHMAGPLLWMDEIHFASPEKP